MILFDGRLGATGETKGKCWLMFWQCDADLWGCWKSAGGIEKEE